MSEKVNVKLPGSFILPSVAFCGGTIRNRIIFKGLAACLVINSYNICHEDILYSVSDRLAVMTSWAGFTQ